MNKNEIKINPEIKIKCLVKKRYKTKQGFRRTKLWISTRASCTCTTMTHTRAHGTHETDPSAMCSGRPSPTHRTRPTRLRCAAGGALCIEIRPEWAEKERRRKTRLRCAAGNSERPEWAEKRPEWAEKRPKGAEKRPEWAEKRPQEGSERKEK